jgi:hypothetical protein
MADFRLGRLKFKWRGDWVASTAYVIDDIVKFGGNSYVCILNHTSIVSEDDFYAYDLPNSIPKWSIHTEGLRHRGDFVPATNDQGLNSVYYRINDVVKYGNTQYRCTTGHRSTQAFNESNWDVYFSGFEYENTWSNTEYYQKGDVVAYGGYTYVATGDNTDSAPNTLVDWEVLTTGFSNKGVYVTSETYEPGNVVKYGGNNYTAKITSNEQILNVGTISGDGSIVTVDFASGQTFVPYAIGDQVTIAGVSVAGYNGTFRVVSATQSGFTYSHTESDVGATGGTITYRPTPINTRYFDLLLEGFNWTGDWNSTTVYQKGDTVNRNSNSYVSIADHVVGASNAPELDPSGNFWNYLSQGGDAAQVLQATGDLLYQAAGGINRIPLGNDGEVLAVGGNPLLPRWETNNVTSTVYYVSTDGSDTWSGTSISRAFRSVRKACDTILALSGAAAPSPTNLITLYVKAGVYDEQLPITVPAHTSLIGDNLRNSLVQPAAGASNMQAIALATPVTHLKFGDVISNAAGTKTAKVLDSDYSQNVHLLNLTGGEWVNTDQYVDIVSHTHADARNLLNSNRVFIANEAYHRHAANDGAVSGTEVDVKSRLAEFVDALGYNVKAGGNNKVWDFSQALLGGQAADIISGDDTQDTALLNYIESIATQVMRNESVTVSSGNTETQVTDGNITVDSSSPYCASVASAITTLVGVVTTSVSNGNMSATVKSEPYITVTSASTRSNAESTMFYVGSHTQVKDMVFGGMSGFVPSASDDKDINTATIRGVYLRLDPNSPIEKSPYIQNCTAIGGAAVGVIVDGAVHKHFNNSSTPSNKSMVFDAYTQVLDGGVGFWIVNSGASEIVSCFTYYAHISYTSTKGGKIRGVSGNSSYGKYGCIASGFNDQESTINGGVKGLRLELDPQAAKNGVFQAYERITGGTSGAVGELISDQSASNYLYFFPVTGSFVQGEVVTGGTSSAFITLLNNTDALTGQKGFLLTVTGLSSAPDQGGSVEMVDDGVNNDPGSFVISNASYRAPDGRGTINHSRALLGSSLATHNGTVAVQRFPKASEETIITSAVPDAATTGGTTTLAVAAIAGMDPGGYLVINNEMFQIASSNSFPNATSVSVTRASEGTTDQSHGGGDTVLIYAPKIASQTEIIEDFDSSSTSFRVLLTAGFAVGDVLKVDSEFFRTNSVVADSTGITILQMADEKTVGATDGQDMKIRYQYSQVRLTAHDFLDIGTGSKANTNWPFLPLSPNVPSNETFEERPGRVYYVSTDQDGNFSVGKFFKVNQATGKATLDASAFDLSGLSSLRLGSIGAQLGASINEFATDGTLSQNSDEKVPTQKAVKTYVDNLSSVDGDFTIGGNLTINGTTTTNNTVDITVKDRNIILGKVDAGSFTGDAAQGVAQITNVSDMSGIAPGVVIVLASGGGGLSLVGGTTVASVDDATTITLSNTFSGTGTASGANFTAEGATDVTSDTGGIIVKGSTDKTFQYANSNAQWSSSENLNLASGKEFRVAGASVLSSSTLGSGVTASSLTSVGTLASLTVSGTLEVQNHAKLAAVSEKLSIISASSSGAQSYDYNLQAVFYHASVTGAITPNFINIPTNPGRAFAVAVVIQQGASAYGFGSSAQINSGAGSITIDWAGGTAPTPSASKKDIYVFNVLNISTTATPSWIIFGSKSEFGA